jgi:transcriptional regulator with XRE-family HTH domain
MKRETRIAVVADLVALRHTRGESVESLADRAGVPHQAFRNLEAGSVETPFLTVLDYCHALEVDLHVGLRDRRTWPGDAPPSIVDILMRGRGGN